MKMRARLWLLVATILADLSSGAGARAEPVKPRIDVARAVEHARFISGEIGARPVNSAAAARSEDYIVAQIEGAGLVIERHDVGMVEVDEVRVGARLVARAQKLFIGDPNLVVRIAAATPSAAAPILIMAHYDSVATTPGAIDNAISVGLLIELARVLADNPPPRPIILAWPAGEETRLAGANKLAEELGAELGLAIALDLVGSRGDLTLNGLSSMLGRDWLAWLAAIARRADVTVSAPWPHRVISRHWPQIERSDHGAFTARGIPAFHIYSRDARSLDLTYHSELDTIDHVDLTVVDDVATFLLTLTMTGGALPASGGEAGMWLPLPGGPYVVSTSAVVILELLLAGFAFIAAVRLTRRWRAAAPRRGLGLCIVVPLYLAIWALVGLLFHLAGGDHPGPWVHSPLRHSALALLVAGSLVTLALVAIERRRPLIGAGRYLAAAIAMPLALGLAILAVDAHELAWLALVASAALASLHWLRSPGLAGLGLAVAALPLCGPLAPGFLREGVFHGFFPPTTPLPIYIGTLLMPYALAALYLYKRSPAPPLSGHWLRRLLVIGPIAIIVSATLALTLPSPRCSSAEFEQRGLACESE